MSEYSEKRIISRVDYHKRCKIINENRKYTGIIQNFSLTGFLILTESTEDFEITDNVTVLLEGLTGETSEIECKIIRTGNNTLGLAFSAVDYDTLMALKELLSDLIDDKEQLEKEVIKMFEGK
jgi:hypothetical protein